MSREETTSGIGIPLMPATILKARIDAGVYQDDLYSGDNLTRIDQDLWLHDWWYTLTFVAPAGHERYTVQFDGLSYRAEIWLNGTLLAGEYDVVGSWRYFEFDVSRLVHQGHENHLAVKIIPERNTPGLVITDIPVDGRPEGVDLADTWADWLNFHYHGDVDAKKTYIPDKNSGIFRRVRLTYGGPVSVNHPYVQTRLPQLSGAEGEIGDEAELTVFADVRNFSDTPVKGRLVGTIAREGAVVAQFDTAVSLAPLQDLEVMIDPSQSPALRLTHPDLWWPYIWGQPALYRLDLTFILGVNNNICDTASLDFGIREVIGCRDDTLSQPAFDDPGSFYIMVNGRNYLVRGGAYSPDLFFESNDPSRVRRIIEHAKDLGLNLLRWEGHLIDDGLLELCDRAGMPAMIGTMCCGAWERWHQWDDEDFDVARASIADTVRAMRAHPSVVIWANGSDGMPPDQVLASYQRALDAAHWQNPVLDSVSTRNRDWSGLHMNGPYTWRAPVYWFLPDNPIATGSCAEEGNNETVPLLSSLKKMLGEQSVWPINDVWAMHGGSVNGQLAVTRKVINRRFGGADSAEEFVIKAQLAQYEGCRAQMEAYGARGWETNKFTVYWMMNSPWPSFFGHIFDWYWGKGGAYFGIKQALRPLTVVFDYFAEGERTTARITVVNETLAAAEGLSVETRLYRPDGTLFASNLVDGVRVGAQSTAHAMTLDRPQGIGALYFVRLTLRDASGTPIGDNTYWQAAEDDVPNLRTIDGIMDAMRVRQYTWPDYSGLFSLPQATVTARLREDTEETAPRRSFTISISNTSSRIAFFLRVEMRNPDTGEEILPSTYSDNFVTVYPGESLDIAAELERPLLKGKSPDLHIEGVNLATFG